VNGDPTKEAHCYPWQSASTTTLIKYCIHPGKKKEKKRKNPGSILTHVGDIKFYFDTKRKILSFRFFAKICK